MTTDTVLVSSCRNPMKSLINKIYIYKFLDGFLPIMPLYLIMLSEHKINPLQISILLILTSFVYIVCEIPTGVLADKYSRKNLLAYGSFLRSIAFVIWLIQPSFIAYLIGFVLWGISSSLISGTYQSLIYDELSTSKRSDMYVKISGRVKGLALTSNVISSALATVLLQFGDWMVIIVSIVMSTLAATTALSLPNPKKRGGAVVIPHKDILINALREIKNSNIIITYLLFSIIVGASFTLIDEYSPLMLLEIGINKTLIPSLAAIFIGVAAVASLYAIYFEKINLHKLLSLLLLTGISIASIALFPGLAVVFLVALGILLLKLIGTVVEGKVQHQITGTSRATIFSIGELTMELLIIVLYGAYGLASQVKTNAFAFSTLGVIIILFVCLILFFSRMYQKTLQTRYQPLA